MNLPVFDLHCDTALALLGKDLTTSGNLRSNSHMIDLERAGTLSGYAQCFACFTTPQMQQWYQKSPIEIFERELAIIFHQIEQNRDVISLTYTPEEIETNCRQGMQSAVLTIEGPAGFGYDPALLEDLYKIGFRITTLGWNESNPLCGSHITGEGLSDLGRTYVAEAQRLGMLVDVSHISDRAFYDIMQITQAPVIASHSNSRSVCHVTRNLSDEMFMEICRVDGVCGFNLYADFVGGRADLDAAAEHFLHFLELDPSGKHLALGGDLDGCDKLVDGVHGIDDYPILLQKLFERGISKDMLYDISWHNALGVMKRALQDNKK